ncbi:DUF2259 domain-containing protein [Mesorhizobium sp. LHD-90]|uniref:DUF2259 domain-containing protein n=1 Tax=Mesorhizobium sp. LHD-90 TaxID=3071414 RepID=UPI0027E1376E|nr:DUF2259 domain-containing protein [Mesorhizobium sp. LHD-90]MDQ6437228.1 DUF2259 domain-containing protein [Mesorhizobium sp. LHD-90]
MRSPFLASLMVLSGMAAAGPVLAGDAAELNILGFSTDGGIFAFEEYGIQDGSGFPYANRFYIDTAKDAFLPGSPIRVRLDDENQTLEAARAEARKKGEAIISEADLARNAGNTVAMNAVAELSADPNRVVANSSPVFARHFDPMEFRIEEFDAKPNASFCADWPIKGFRLLSIDAKAGGTTKLLHEDKDVPASRGCALGYRIGAVQTFFPNRRPGIAVVILAVSSVGFEGPDYRWLALPTGLPD